MQKAEAKIRLDEINKFATWSLENLEGEVLKRVSLFTIERVVQILKETPKDK